jgi:hypothetical protein
MAHIWGPQLFDLVPERTGASDIGPSSEWLIFHTRIDFQASSRARWTGDDLHEE